MVWYDVLAGILALVIGWGFDTFVMYFLIRSRAQKKWNKCKRLYPYFSGNILQKIFLYGLKGEIDISIVVLTYITNISCLLGVVTGIWCIISPENIIVEYVFCTDLGVWLFVSICKNVILYLSPPEF